jgi:aminoglycoside phosphotransferase family enzyme/predicted kinase
MSHVTQSQDEVFAFLADPASHGGEKVVRIDTHGAAVFLAGSRVLKVKRAVKFPFLDYSTLEKRKAACQAELEVNRPFAPQIYRGVVAITRKRPGALAIGGQGEVVEWALEMARFDEKATLDHLADAGRIDDALADALGRAVASAHDKAPLVEAAPWIAALSDYIAQNDEAFREFPALFANDEIAALTGKSREAFARMRPLLEKRGTMGLIRRGHGDLHLGNIVLIDGKPVLFDALEFDPVVASGDLLYDLAFLLMDLVERKLPNAANIVFNRYLAETARDDDFDALAALPLFLSVRAAIRAKVTAAKLEHAKEAERRRIGRSARDYFELAANLIKPPAPALLAVGGLSGTGKSVLARGLAPYALPSPGAVVLRSDVMRKRLFGANETDKLPQEAYSAQVTRKIYSALAGQARRVIAAGHSAVVDAVFAKDDEREEIAAVANGTGKRFRGLFLTADLATRIARVGARVNDASDADEQVVRKQAQYDLGAMEWSEVDASGTPEQTLAKAKMAVLG